MGKRLNHEASTKLTRARREHAEPNQPRPIFRVRFNKVVGGPEARANAEKAQLSRRLNKVKVTLPRMPWDDEESSE